MKENVLVGKIILDMKIASDKKAVLFIIQGDGGTIVEEIIVKVDGDCCSDTWIEHIDLPINGFPAKVQLVEDLDFPLLVSEEGHALAQYGCKIKTDKGDVFIEYRNESNGYYGGSLHWPDKYWYDGGVYNQNVSTQKWIEIKE